MSKENTSLNKKLGIYYTPQYIIDFILSYIFILGSKDKKDPSKLTILDPSCGNGLFLQSIFYSISLNKNTAEKIRILKNIHGVDINPHAIEDAKTSLQKFFPNDNITEILSKNILPGNSLIDDKSIDPNNALNWASTFPIITKNGGFDIIIGNPPWVALKGKQSPIIMDQNVLNYFFNKYNCDRYRPNLFELFIWKSMDLLKPGGYLGFIIPDRICTNKQFINLRKFILENMQIKYLWLKPVFENVISDNVVIILKKEKPTPDSKLLISEYPLKEFTEIPQIRYLNDENYKWVLLKSETIRLFEKIRQNPNAFHLKNSFHSHVGFIGKKGYVTKKRINNNQIPVIKGENIQTFSIKDHYYFDFKRENMIGGSLDFNRLQRKNKVFVRKTGKKIIAAFDDTGFVPEQSVYFIYIDTNERNNLIILSAILNSKLMNYYYNNFAITNKNSTPQLKKIDLDEFPIILPYEESSLLKFSLRMYDLKKNPSEHVDEINKITQLIDSEINKLYGLTDEEIDLISKD
jgi:adenine-specific DNA-methyltransferase